MSIRPVPASMAVDIAMLADFRMTGEPAWRVAQEIRIQAGLGYSTALVHMPLPGCDGGSVHPEIDACVREGLATPLPAQDCWLRTDLLIVALPDCLAEMPEAVPHIAARRTLVVVEGEVPDDVESRHRLCRSLFGAAPSWTATTEPARRRLAELVPTEPTPWLPAIAAALHIRQAPRRRPVIGRTSLSDRSHWPAPPELFSIYPLDGRTIVRVLGRPDEKILGVAAPPAWEIFADDISLERFIGGLDFLVHYPGPEPKDVPITAIAMALAKGIPVLLPPDLEPLVGPGPHYIPAAEANAAVLRLHVAPETDTPTTMRFGPQIHAQRLRGLLDTPEPTVKPVPRLSGARRVLFVSSNGVGLGHLTRLLAIARRLPPIIEPVFATMSQALPIVEEFGFPVEHITSHLYTGVNSVQWNGWLRRQLDDMIDYHDAAAVVLDSTNPYDGVIRSVLPRSRCALIWIRRGLWRPTAVNRAFLNRSRYFDLVIEPEDIAEPGAARDLAAQDRNGVLRVPPIRLLDPEELLPREAAAAELGLDPARPAVLVQLGSGANRDIVRMTDHILGVLAHHPGLQVVVVEWLIANAGMQLWDGVINLRGYPTSRYFRAFDFTISAAGYNSFTEALTFGLPAIFVANDHYSMDDQAARSRFAHDNGAAFHLPERDLGALDGMVQALLDPETRDFMRFNALRLARENGAEAAARAVAAQIGPNTRIGETGP